MSMEAPVLPEAPTLLAPLAQVLAATVPVSMTVMVLKVRFSQMLLLLLLLLLMRLNWLSELVCCDVDLSTYLPPKVTVPHLLTLPPFLL